MKTSLLRIKNKNGDCEISLKEEIVTFLDILLVTLWDLKGNDKE